jgi:hypothetical protein
MLKNIVNMVAKLKRTFTQNVITCERCFSGEEALYHVYSDVIHVRVCKRCAEEARRLGLRVEPINSSKDAA